MCLVIEDCERVINVIHLFPLKSYWPALLFFLIYCYDSSLSLLLPRPQPIMSPRWSGYSQWAIELSLLLLRWDLGHCDRDHFSRGGRTAAIRFVFYIQYHLVNAFIMQIGLNRSWKWFKELIKCNVNKMYKWEHFSIEFKLFWLVNALGHNNNELNFYCIY